MKIWCRLILNTIIFVLRPIFSEIQTKNQFWRAKIHTGGECGKLCISTKGDLINIFQKNLWWQFCTEPVVYSANLPELQSSYTLWWCQTTWLEIFLPIFHCRPYSKECFFGVFWLLSGSHVQNTLECMSRITLLGWLAPVFRWQLKCWFVTLSRVSLPPSTRPITQRRWFFFYYPSLI